MTMADIMFSHSRLYECLGVAHCNFHLRPGDCDLDEKLVEEWAAAHSLPFYKKDFDTAAYAADHSVSIEMAARELRYAWFAELCSEHGYDAVAVAHNANDNAETLVLNLLRGTGLRGITGMSDDGQLVDMTACATLGIIRGGTASAVGSRGARRHVNQQAAVIRPLLKMTRAEIEKYAEEHGVVYRNDATNFENEYKRNKIRNQVFPVFGEINPSFVQTLNRDMEHFADAAEIIGEWCDKRRSEVMDGDVISVPALMAEKHWEYLLYTILDEYGFSATTITCVKRLLLDESATFSGKTFHADDYKLVTARDRLILVTDPDPWELSADDLDIEAYPYKPGMNLKCQKGTILFDSDKLPDDAVLRCWLAGDWFKPFGMKGRKKLSDLFTDLHYSAVDKRKALVLAPADSDDHHIFAVIGVRIDNRIKVTPETTEVTSITLRK